MYRDAVYVYVNTLLFFHEQMSLMNRKMTEWTK